MKKMYCSLVLVLMVLAMKAQLPSSVTINNFIPCTIGGIPYDFNGTLTLTAPNNYHRVDQTGINYYLFFNTENNINRWQMGYAVNFTPFINRAFFTNASNDMNVIPCTGWTTDSDCSPDFTFSTCIPTCTTPTITGDLDPSVTVCESQQFIIYASAHGAVSDLSVKWQRNGIDITTPFPYQPDNYNGFSYPNVPISEDGAKYRAVFISACSGEEVATSECTIHVTPSVSAGALKFDGINDNVDLGSFANQQVFSIEMWVKPGATQVQYADIIDNNHSDYRSWVCQQLVNTTNQYEFFVSGSTIKEAITFSLEADAWQHLVLVKEPNAVKVYINGGLVGSAYHSGNVAYDGSQFLRLGNWGGGGRNWQGEMDEVRIWNRALCSYEIQEHLSCELNGTQTGLLAYYKCNQGIVGCNNSDLTILNDETGTHNGILQNFILKGANSNFTEGIVSGTCSSVGSGELTTYYADSDFDGYGNPSVSLQACTAPQGYVDNKTDCDDTKASVYPGATEICNGIDDNCDGQIDEGVKTTYYADSDGDGYGNPSVSVQACTAPQGYVANKTDCDDTKASVHSGATEICNGLDDNCDGQIDEGVKTTYYADADGDGYGNPSISVQACIAPQGYVANKTDCDDTKASVHPGATEICNGIDDNCDGHIDEGIKTTYYADTDGDGYGNPLVSVQACTVPQGYVANKTDCNDSKASVHPGATEICGNNIDDNCNGQVDENCSCILTASLPSCKTFYHGYASSVTLTPIVTGSTSLTYRWSNGATTSSIIVSPSKTTTYSVTISAGPACSVFISIKVEVIDVRCGIKNSKVQLCHKGNSICTESSEVPIHLSHGDKLGTCGLVVCEPYQPNVANLTLNNNEQNNQMLEERKNTIFLYPNPTKQDFIIEYNLEKTTDVMLSLMDVNGRTLWNKEVKNVLEVSETVDVSNLSAGIYFIKVLAIGEEMQVRRLIITQ